jgi:hypothetical protein
MSDSRPAVLITHDDWTDVLAASGISAGSTVLIQNIGRSIIWVSNTSTKPGALTPQAGATVGAQINPGDTWQANTAPALWVISTDRNDNSYVVVQEA